MKKIYKVSLTAMTLLTLVACGPKRRPRTQPSTVQSEVADGKVPRRHRLGMSIIKQFLNVIRLTLGLSSQVIVQV